MPAPGGPGAAVVGFSFKTDSDRAAERLNALARRQTPFALSQAINDALRDAQRAVVAQMPAKLDRPTPFTLRGIAIRRSHKRRLVGVVYIKPLQAEYLRWQIEGGTRLPRGRAIAVGQALRRNRYGNLPRGALQKLRQRKDTFSGTVNGTPGLWQRDRDGGLRLMVLYADQARYTKRLPFYAITQGTLAHRLPRHFQRRLAAAIRSAR